MPTQSRQSQRVSSVVGEIEPTLEGKHRPLSVGQTRTTGLNETVELGLAYGFLL